MPDDSELIVSPGRQVFNRFMERKFAVFSVFVVLVMFLVVFIAPHFMTKYYDSFTETTQKDLPPTMDFMNVPKELAGNVKMIDSYSSFSVGLSNDGKVYVWGIGSIGATGVNVKQIPEEVKNAKIAFVAAGQDHIIAIGEDGKFYGWGSNRFGQYEGHGNRPPATRTWNRSRKLSATANLILPTSSASPADIRHPPF